MPIASRRSLLKGPKGEVSKEVVSNKTASTAQPVALTPQTTTPPIPPIEIIALHRMGYGPRPGDADRIRSMGFMLYVDEQLSPSIIDDTACENLVKSAKLKIKYDAAGDGSYPARHEAANLTTLNQSTTQLWQERQLPKNKAWAERVRPADEVRVATWIRAVHSKCQLRETLVDFWHNHFNVNAYSDSAISVTFPVYDRLIRNNCLGNFRTFLEAVAKSTAMMYYLDNVSNKAGGGESGNENFAREMLELHTLGADSYLGFVEDRSSVGTISYNGTLYSKGYTEDDIFEAARCLTGWTIANGHWELPSGTPNTGEFYYYNTWHDAGRKMFLNVDCRQNITRNQPPLKDAQDLFTILAGHPNTARHICTKLCRRFIADNPPQTVIDAAVDTWMANINSPDQIKQVVRTILLSPEFKSTWGKKIKTPFKALVSYLRATNATLPNDYVDTANAGKGSYWSGLMWNMGTSGHNLFSWPTPTGHPDVASYWTSTNGMLRRWNLPYIVSQEWGGNVKINIKGQTNLQSSCTQIVDFWIGRLCGYSINSTLRQELITFMAQGFDPNQPPKPLSGTPDWNDPNAVTDRLISMVQLIAMYPDFHLI
jgi:uncharacterized protein (DUF1800 family)